METEKLKLLCDMTVQLTKLRQNECKHLSIENTAPEIFSNLLSSYASFMIFEYHANKNPVDSENQAGLGES